MFSPRGVCVGRGAYLGDLTFTMHQEVMGYLVHVVLDTLITIHQEVMGYLVLLDTLITIHQEVMGYIACTVRYLD
jgi:hypothetical protein